MRFHQSALQRADQERSETGHTACFEQFVDGAPEHYGSAAMSMSAVWQNACFMPVKDAFQCTTAPKVDETSLADSLGEFLAFDSRNGGVVQLCRYSLFLGGIYVC
jgi:hypothetical protein